MIAFIFRVRALFYDKGTGWWNMNWARFPPLPLEAGGQICQWAGACCKHPASDCFLTALHLFFFRFSKLPSFLFLLTFILPHSLFSFLSSSPLVLFSPYPYPVPFLTLSLFFLLLPSLHPSLHSSLPPIPLLSFPALLPSSFVPHSNNQVSKKKDKYGQTRCDEQVQQEKKSTACLLDADNGRSDITTGMTKEDHSSTCLWKWILNF